MTEKHFMLIYEAGENYLERRKPFRDAHLRLARAAKECGDLVLAGAFADPADGAALVFKGKSDAAARVFAENDPYVRNGVIKTWRVREWTTVVGDLALTKV